MQIAEIRQQVARTEVFRGYRSMPVAFSGLLALGTAAFQALWLPDPQDHPGPYLTLWFGAAFISALAAGMEMALRSWTSPSSWKREITRLAVGQFLPCLVAGGFLTVVVALFAPTSLWLLPGLWQILFSLGIFASYRLLPRPIFGVAVFYLSAGLVCLALGQGEAALSPWLMGVPFGIGQLYTAGILYWTLERTHDDFPEQE